MRAEMWCPQKLPVKDMVLKRNEGFLMIGVTGGRRGESMSRFDLDGFRPSKAL